MQKDSKIIAKYFNKWNFAKSGHNEKVQKKNKELFKAKKLSV